MCSRTRTCWRSRTSSPACSPSSSSAWWSRTSSSAPSSSGRSEGGACSTDATLGQRTQHVLHPRLVRSRVERALFHEAQVVAQRVDHVKGALAPWALRHGAGGLAVHLVRSERLESVRATVHRLEVTHREVERLGTGCRRQPASRRVEHRENHTPAIAVVTGTWVPLALGAEQLGVE